MFCLAMAPFSNTLRPVSSEAFMTAANFAFRGVSGEIHDRPARTLDAPDFGQITEMPVRLLNRSASILRLAVSIVESRA